MASIKGLDSLMRKLDKLGGDTMEALGKAVEVTTLKAEATAKENAPVGKYSQSDSSGCGSLRGSISHEMDWYGETTKGTVFTNVPHAAFVEFGTGPVGAANHAGISPHVSPTYTSRKQWVYPAIVDGKETFVTTSGQPARPYLYPAAVQMKKPFKEITGNLLKIAIRKVAGGG